jgi:hypothetical protein
MRLRVHQWGGEEEGMVTHTAGSYREFEEGGEQREATCVYMFVSKGRT